MIGSGCVEVKHAGDWTYRAEGGRNLVVSYCGSSSLLNGRVLRLAKRKVGQQSGRRNKIDSCKSAYHFARERMAPLLSPRGELLLIGQLVAVASPFLTDLGDKCQSLRPAHRLSLQIDDAATHAWMLPDLCYLPGVSGGVVTVEIKPKSCVLPSATDVCVGHEIKTRVSRFVMMQQWKLDSSHTHALSAYDPLDLFSGDTLRVRAALRELLRVPQNNLRVHTDGIDALHTGQGLGHGTDTRAVLEGVFGASSGEEETLQEAFVCLLEAALRDSCVLQVVERLQRVCAYDIESVAPMEQHLRHRGGFSEEDARSAAPSELPQVSEWDSIVESFLLAQSAKDCSVFFALAAVPSGENTPSCWTFGDGHGLEDSARGGHYGLLEHPEGSGRRIMYRCALVDLDQKSRDKIPGYLEQDAQVVRSYLQAQSSGQAKDRWTGRRPLRQTLRTTAVPC